MYRLAWGELTGVDLSREVHATFYYVRTGERVVTYDELAGPERAGTD